MHPVTLTRVWGAFVFWSDRNRPTLRTAFAKSLRFSQNRIASAVREERFATSPICIAVLSIWWLVAMPKSYNLERSPESRGKGAGRVFQQPPAVTLIRQPLLTCGSVKRWRSIRKERSSSNPERCQPLKIFLVGARDRMFFSILHSQLVLTRRARADLLHER